MVRAKKHLGQHFLRDSNIARKVVAALPPETAEGRVLEVGPGMGVLTALLLQREGIDLRLAEVDRDSLAYLQEAFPEQLAGLQAQDFLKTPMAEWFAGQTFGLVGNLPYNIASPIFFRVLEHHQQIPTLVAMVQKEVAERLIAPHGSKTYGILSVLVQAYYRVEYLFTVSNKVFQPPPKVTSAVVRFRLRPAAERPKSLPFPHLKGVVKQAFNQRRKTLRNALKSRNLQEYPVLENYGALRAEQLSVPDFLYLASVLAQS